MNAKTKTANCAVLNTTDDSHVTRQTPLDCKRRDLLEADTDDESCAYPRSEQTPNR